MIEQDALMLSLPWPPSTLSPNARPKHWSILARAKRRYRAACALSAQAQGARRMVADSISVRLQFAPPDKRHRDWDNMVASVKAGLDGLVDVLGVDDSRWRVSFEVGAPQRGGAVKVEVMPC
jgi:crossover junction endodeoxyribonuclease RusA